jgi:hypothetical protein
MANVFLIGGNVTDLKIARTKVMNWNVMTMSRNLQVQKIQMIRIMYHSVLKINSFVQCLLIAFGMPGFATEKKIAKMVLTNPRKFVPTDQHVTETCFDAKDPDSAFPTTKFVTKCPTVLMAVTNLDVRMNTIK